MKKDKIDYPLKLLFKTSLFVLFGVAFSKIFSYIYRVIVARHFGAEIYGLFSLSTVIIGLLVTICSFGIAEGVLRFFSLYRGEKNKKQVRAEKIKYLYNITFKILIFSSLATAIISFFLSDFISITIFHDSGLSISLKIFSFMIPFWVFSRYYLSIILSYERVKQNTIIEAVMQNFAKVFFLVVFIFLGFKVNAVIFSFFLGMIVLFLLSYFYCKYNIPQILDKSILDKKTKKDILSSLFSYCWPVMFFGIVSLILYWIDSFTIDYFKTAVEVGVYNAALPIATLLAITPELFLRLLFPLITKEYSRKNFTLIKELAKQVGKWVFIINFPVFLLIFVFPGAIINILFGAEYLAAETALRFLSVGAFLSSVFIISNNLISMTGKSKAILFDLAIASAVNIVLNIIFVPMPSFFGIDNSLGINGAAFATMISMAILNILFAIQAKKYTSIIPIRRKMLRIALISAIPFFILLYIKTIIPINIFTLIIMAVLFFGIYFVLLFFLKGFDENDLMILRSIKNKIFFLNGKPN